MGAIQQGIQTIIGGATIGKLAGREVDKLKKEAGVLTGQVDALKEQKTALEGEYDEFADFVHESIQEGMDPTTGAIIDIKKYESSIKQKMGSRQPEHSEAHSKIAEYSTQQELGSRKSQIEKFNERIAKGKALRGEL